MTLPASVRDSAVRHVETFCENRAPADARYDAEAGMWSLYAADRNERWFPYDSAEPTGDVGPLLAEIADDATGIFWG